MGVILFTQLVKYQRWKYNITVLPQKRVKREKYFSTLATSLFVPKIYRDKTMDDKFTFDRNSCFYRCFVRKIERNCTKINKVS